MGEVTSYTKQKLDELIAGAGSVTQADIDSAISALVDSSPATLNTLNELAAALGDDPNFATTIVTALGAKADLVSGKVPSAQLPPTTITESLEFHSSVGSGFTSANKNPNVAGVLQPDFVMGSGAALGEYLGTYYVSLNSGYLDWTRTFVEGEDILISGYQGNTIYVSVDGGALTTHSIPGSGGFVTDGVRQSISAGLHTVRFTGSGASLSAIVLRTPSLPYVYSALSIHGALLTGNETVVITNPPATAGKMTFVFKQDATGGRVITWPTSVFWAGGIPLPSKAANSYEVYELTTTDGGVTWVGVLLGEDADLAAMIPLTQKGVANGVASLGSDGKVPTGQLPTASAEVSGALIGYKAYEPGTAVSVSANSTMAEVDATNLSVTFTVPASGKVVIRLAGMSYINNSILNWGLLDGTTLVGQKQLVSYQQPNNFELSVGAEFEISGLTPGATKTYKWAHQLSSGSTVATRYGSYWGNAIMQVFAVGAAVADSNLQTIIDAVSLIASNNQTGTAYTPVLSDAGKTIELNNAAAIVLTIPTNATTAFPIGTVIELWQQGAGQVTITPAAGVTVRAPGGLNKTYGQYSGATLRKRATDEWVLQGDLA